MLIYFARSRTLGQMLMKLQLVNNDGSKPKISKLFIRSLVLTFPILPLIITTNTLL
jgi:uncharacterized RDD family membrane protein YckC